MGVAQIFKKVAMVLPDPGKVDAVQVDAPHVIQLKHPWHGHMEAHFSP
jgi:hypothetical protein